VENKKYILKGVLQKAEERTRNRPYTIYEHPEEIPELIVEFTDRQKDIIRLHRQRSLIYNMIMDIYKKHCGLKQVVDVNMDTGKINTYYERI